MREEMMLGHEGLKIKDTVEGRNEMNPIFISCANNLDFTFVTGRFRPN
jgi:hypothetical protein